mmetsp:Transcript_15127/g.21425  ORF Transcript_15127/g.21425 Transcript_15127/m.21425 type:complete len:161 (-) Transcript_15127:80-562(-)
MSLLNKLTAWNSKPTYATFPELIDVIIWKRFVLAILYGTHLGLSQTRGAVGILFGMNVVTFFPVLYCSTYLNADTESYPNLTFAGVPNAMALLLLIWIYFYTAEYSDDESQMAAAFAMVQNMANEQSSSTDDISSGDATMGGAEDTTTSPPIPAADEQEF